MFSLCRIAAVAAALVIAPAVLAANVSSEAQTLIDQGKPAEALKLLETHLDKNPQDAEARFTRGLVLVRMDRTDDAIQVFADLTRDYPQLPEPYNNLAVLYAGQGNYEKARDALEAALATHPAYATAHENLGDIYAALAGAAYNRALQLDKANQTLRHKLALINQLDSAAIEPVPAAPAVAAAVPASQPAAAATAAPAAAVPVPAPAVAPVAVDKPEPARSEPAASAVAPVSESDRRALLTAAEAWAAAWSKQDLSAYFTAYADGFVPEGGLSRQAWETQRRDRISGPKEIRVELSDLQVESTGADAARVSFLQDYSSDTFSDSVRKVLDMTRTPGGWKIAREYTR